MINYLTITLLLIEGKSAPKTVKDKEVKQKRKKRDAAAPKKPMCAFFWYQRDPKNHITDENLQHKDKIKVSSFLKRGVLTSHSNKLIAESINRLIRFKTVHVPLRPKNCPIGCKRLLLSPLLSRSLLRAHPAALDSGSSTRIWFDVFKKRNNQIRSFTGV